jgi:hypothetical protein
MHGPPRPLPRGGRRAGFVAAAVPLRGSADDTDLAILGTVTNLLAGAVESSHRLAESEALQRAADVALQEAALHAEALARRNRLLKEARHELVVSRERELVADERQRIARDLHDSVAQHVLSMGMQVEWCRTSTSAPELAERLGEVKELARSTVRRIREPSSSSRAGTGPERAGLPAALQRLARQHGVHGLSIEVAVDEPLPGLPVAVERTLFMVAKRRCSTRSCTRRSAVLGCTSPPLPRASTSSSPTVSAAGRAAPLPGAVPAQLLRRLPSGAGEHGGQGAGGGRPAAAGRHARGWRDGRGLRAAGRDRAGGPVTATGGQAPAVAAAPARTPAGPTRLVIVGDHAITRQGCAGCWSGA